MPRVSIRSSDQAKTVALPRGYSGMASAVAYFDDAMHPLHVYQFTVGENDALRIEGNAVDRLAFVSEGGIRAGGRQLDKGSSLIVERGAELDLHGTATQSTLVAFEASHPPETPLAGGRVHLLPANEVPRTENLGGRSGLGGAMHANAECHTCKLWLHENEFAKCAMPPSDPEAGVHSHSEDEVIFVIGGEMRIGKKLYGPGTALAIAAETLYSFTAGPAGLHFINFRAGRPGDIKFARGAPISETAYWHERLPPPQYLAPLN
jgi:hypothetical protein